MERQKVAAAASEGGRKRSEFLRSIIAVASILNCQMAVAQPDQYSANFKMPGCREVAALIAFSNPSNDRSDLVSFCLGIIVGLSYVGRSDGTMCLPVDVTREQTVRAVMQYIDGQPSRMNENFVPFAIEALQAAWPCKHYSTAWDLIPRLQRANIEFERSSFVVLSRADRREPQAKELRSPLTPIYASRI